MLKKELEALVSELREEIAIKDRLIEKILETAATSAVDRKISERNTTVLQGVFQNEDPPLTPEEEETQESLQRLFFNPMTPEEMRESQPETFFPFEKPVNEDAEH